MLVNDKQLAEAYGRRFCEATVASTDDLNLDSHANRIKDAMENAASILQPAGRVSRRPWISAVTLGLLNQRDDAQRQGNLAEQQKLNKRIKASVQKDKRDWLDSELAEGHWKVVRALHKKVPKRPIQIQDERGQFVESTKRADTLADYFEQVQWQVAYATLAPSGNDDIGDTLPIYTGAFGMQELQDALRALATGKAAGVDDVAPELWKALARSSEACGELLAFFQKC